MIGRPFFSRTLTTSFAPHAGGHAPTAGSGACPRTSARAYRSAADTGSFAATTACPSNHAPQAVVAGIATTQRGVIRDEMRLVRDGTPPHEIRGVKGGKVPPLSLLSAEVTN